MKSGKPKILFLHSAGHQHGDEGSSRLISYLKKNLSHTFDIIAPIMPHPDDPDYESWKTVLHEILKIMDNNMIIVGHSLGGSVLLKFLSEEKFTKTIRALFLVAVPYWGFEDWEADEFILRDSFVKHLPTIKKISIYHSQDDEIISPTHAEKYAEEIPAADLYQLNGYGHVFWDGLPELVEAIKNL
jgi:uncharacterized protein